MWIDKEVDMPRLREELEFPITPEDFVIPDSEPESDRMVLSDTFIRRSRRNVVLRRRRARSSSRRRRH